MKVRMTGYVPRVEDLPEADQWPPPWEYLGRPTAWTRVARSFGDPVLHKHSCPECYDHWDCSDRCTLEPDLEDEGVPFGSHYECEPCRKHLAEEAARQARAEAARREMEEARQAHIHAAMMALGA